jgi:hypothetical protein
MILVHMQHVVRKYEASFLLFYRLRSIHLSLFIPVAPTWSIGHPSTALFHFGYLILDSR